MNRWMLVIAASATAGACAHAPRSTQAAASPLALQPGQVIRAYIRPGAPVPDGVPLRAASKGPDRFVEGGFERSGPDSLWFRLPQPPVSAALPWPSVERIQVPGKRRSNWKAGLLVGIAVGILSAKLYYDEHPDEREGAAYAGNAVVYGGIGLLIGSLTHHRTWRTVPLDSIPR